MSQPEKPYALGFLGLGIMGQPMVERLISRGWTVTVWNYEPELKAWAESVGAVWAETPAQVRERSDVVLICVLHAKAVENCCFGPGGLARASTGAATVVDCSTMNPDKAIALSAALKERAGMAWMDAPISGGPEPAAEGKLTLIAGGDQDLFDRLKPIFDDLATNSTLMGPIGSGQAVKVINQAIVGTSYTLMAEVLAIAKAAGIEPDRLPDCLAGGLADSQILQRIYPQMAHRDYQPPKSYARQLNKDMQNIGVFVERLGLELPLLDAAIARYDAYVAEGNELKDSASIATFYDR
ncbi:NAD(P)-dependent oxidoreductase [Pelagibacterium montanilacus]|uniref:NAD(P)-dependent oxidoreductase n=1 Tax=Pelagibacterium montanilacus TaxID=2185280 RepID=UPI000F8E63B7|nr:NAD(P)-dependent oxidoreductase [Pelagibacterium montanilacus]